MKRPVVNWKFKINELTNNIIEESSYEKQRTNIQATRILLQWQDFAYKRAYK
jgi:hypothetical protein